MPKRSRTTDPNQSAFNVIQRILAAGEREKKEKPKDPLAVALGRRGGLKGGRARADKLSPAQRRASARKAARARWDKENG